MLKEWFLKQRLLWILRSRNKENDVVVYFDEDNLIFAKKGRKVNEYIAVRLPMKEIRTIQEYIEDGSFLIYSGQIQYSIYQYILRTRWKWEDIVRWYE